MAQIELDRPRKLGALFLMRCSFRGWERPIRRCPDDAEAAGFLGGFNATVALAAVKGDKTTAQLASQFSVPTSQITASKKRLLEQAAGLFEGGRGRRDETAADEQELYEQIGRLKMEVEWLKKICRARLTECDDGSTRIHVANRAPI